MKKITAALCILFAITACKDKETQESEDTFDKGALLTNMADNYIIPHYAELQTRLGDLMTNWAAFDNNTSPGNHIQVQASFVAVCEEYQRVKMFDFGPAMTHGMTMAFGVFPTDTAQIVANINSGSYDLSTTDNADAQGLDALDYLLFRQNAYASLSGSSSATRAYVNELIAKLISTLSAVRSEWQTSYRSTFVAGTGTSLTSPFSLLVNNFCKDYELTKNTKLGIPIGKPTLDIAQPLYFEAKWSKQNRRLLAIAVQASSDIYFGMGTAGNGQGFDDYLQALDRADINNSISTRFNYMNTEIATWNDDLLARLGSNYQSLSDYYDYMHATVVYLKTDMPSAFGVVISYQDNDGD